MSGVDLSGLYGLLSSVAVSGSLGLSFLLAFGALRRSSRLALRWFMPKAVHDAVEPERHGGRLEPAAQLPVAWLRPLMALPEEALLRQAGLDAVVFLRLFAFGSKLFALLSLCLVPTLCPLFWTAARRGSGAGGRPTWAEKVSAASVPPGASVRLWCLIGAAYFVTGVTLLLLRTEYRHVAALRLNALATNQRTAEAYTLLCLDIPEDPGQTRAQAPEAAAAAAAAAAAQQQQPARGRRRAPSAAAAAAGSRARALAGSAADLAARAAASVAYGTSVAPPGGASAGDVEAELTRLHPGLALRVLCVPHLVPVERAFERWERALERAREACTAAAHEAGEEAAGGGGGGAPAARCATPATPRPPRAGAGAGAAGAGGGQAPWPSLAEPLLPPPAVATLWRQRWTGAPPAARAAREAGRARAALLAAQRAAAAAPSHAAFLVFASRRAAATAAHGLLHPNPLHWQLRPAPAPGAVLWPNLRLRWWERRVRGAAATAVSAVIVLFFLAPVTFVSSLAAAERLHRLLPGLADWEAAHPAARAAVQDTLPGLALTGALSAVPFAFGRLAKRQGCASVDEADRQVASRVFAVLLLDVFLGATVSHAIVLLLLALSQLQWEASLKDVLTLLGETVPASAPLFISFIVARAFAGLPLELSRLSAMASAALRSAMQQPDVFAPGRLPFGTQVPNTLLVALLGLVYAPIAPMVLPFAAVFFALGGVVWRHQVLFVYTRAYESNGAWWPHIASRTLWSLLVGHATLAALLALKLGGGDPGQGRATALLAGPALLPLPLAVAAAFHHHSTRFAPIFARVPLSCAAQMDEADGADGGSGIDRFARAYEAPCMRPPHELEAEDPRRWLLPVPYDRLALGDAEEGGGGAVAATPARVGESGAAPKPLRTPSQLPLQDN